MKILLILLLIFQAQIIFSEDYSNINYYDFYVFNKFNSINTNIFLQNRYFSQQSENLNLNIEESLMMKTIEDEIIFENFMIKEIYPVNKFDSLYLSDILENRNEKVKIHFLITFDSSLAASIKEKLVSLDSVALINAIETLTANKEGYEITSAEFTWENLHNPIRDIVFSLDNYSVGEVIRYPDIYTLPIRFYSESIPPINTDTMSEEWFEYIGVIKGKEKNITLLLSALNTSEVKYNNETIKFLFSADSEHIQTSIIPAFPSISKDDSLRVFSTSIAGDITVGELLVKFRRKGLFPHLSDTLNLRLLFERTLLYETLIYFKYSEEYLKDPMIQAEIEFKKSQYLSQLLYKKTTDTIYVNLEEMKEFYNNNINIYMTGDLEKYRMILVKDSIFADSLKTLVSLDYSMDSLARLYSIHITAPKGGESEWRKVGQQGTLQPYLKDMEIGDLSALFHTIDGWAFIRLDEFKESTPLPFDSFQVKIKNNCRAEKIEIIMDNYYQEMQNNINLSFDLRSLKQFVLYRLNL